MEEHLIPGQAARIEIRAGNSRFIASGGPAFSVAEARAFIAAVRDELADASHHVPVYVIGHGSSTLAHSSDDGEPSGTAGRPALAVLQGSGLGDVVMVITRYFGGKRLGTGGLVRAYSDAVRALLEILPRARKMATHRVQIRLPYSLYQQCRLLVLEHAGELLEETFAEDILLKSRFPVVSFDRFQSALGELSHGTLQAAILETCSNTIMPIDPSA